MKQKLLIVFPSDFFERRAVDPDLAREYDACLETGLYEAVLFDYEQWFHGDRLVLTEKFGLPRRAVYRGWMMKPEKYEAFYMELLKRNVHLVTDPAQYEYMHVFPNVYPALGEDTARMLIYPDGAPPDLGEIRRSFRRFMVKDYVKSVKGTDFPRYFENTVTREEFDREMEKFYRYRGGLYTGGICIKEYLKLKEYIGRTNEYRAYYVQGQVLCVSRNSGQGDFAPAPPEALILKYRSLPASFYTMDFAELEDGTWKILETGDGGVSGLSEGQDYPAFFRGLYCAINK